MPIGDRPSNADPFATAVHPAQILDVLGDLRASGDVPWSATLGGWVLSSHSTVRAALTNQTASASRNTMLRVNPASQRAAHRTILLARENALLFVDGQRHRALRGSLTGSHTELPNLDLAAAATQLASAHRHAGIVEAVGSFSEPLALLGLTRQLGVDAAYGPELKHWSDAIALAWSPTAGEQDFERAALALNSLETWFAAVECHAGLGLRLTRAVAEGTSTLPEALGHLMAVVSAGYGTTRDLVSNALLRLATDSRFRERMHDGCDLPTLDEIIRLDGPVMVTRREAVSPLVFDGRRIDAGESIVIALASANRDPAVFIEPERFDADRPNLRLAVSFGFGSHRCAAATAGKNLLDAALRAWISVFPDCYLADEPQWRNSATMRGLDRLPFRIGTRFSQTGEAPTDHGREAPGADHGRGAQCRSQTSKEPTQDSRT